MLSSLLLFGLAFAICAAGSQEAESNANSGLRPRNSAPSFKAKSVIDDKFKDIALDDYTNRGQWVVLVMRLSKYHSRIMYSLSA